MTFRLLPFFMGMSVTLLSFLALGRFIDGFGQSGFHVVWVAFFRHKIYLVIIVSNLSRRASRSSLALS